jgi:hypothetical protein
MWPQFRHSAHQPIRLLTCPQGHPLEILQRQYQITRRNVLLQPYYATTHSPVLQCHVSASASLPLPYLLPGSRCLLATIGSPLAQFGSQVLSSMLATALYGSTRFYTVAGRIKLSSIPIDNVIQPVAAVQFNIPKESASHYYATTLSTDLQCHVSAPALRLCLYLLPVEDTYLPIAI